MPKTSVRSVKSKHRQLSHVEGKPALLGSATLLVVLFSLAVRLGPAQATVSTVTVQIDGFQFVPGTITVVIGVNNTVNWVNGDGVAHTVTANGGSFSSGTMVSGANFTHTFNTPGTFGYHCSFHTFMTGTVTVLGSGVTSTTSSGSTTTSSTTTTTSSLSAAGKISLPAEKV
ncbi:MAG: cupredoxin domain-containing protein [Thaumarchaeota archaeon]|nr:cupredoxin domain-containing protein [Nitrososphaerota archaeon]